MKKNVSSLKYLGFNVIILFFLLTFCISAQAQDKIIKKGGEILEVKILEIIIVR